MGDLRAMGRSNVTRIALSVVVVVSLVVAAIALARLEDGPIQEEALAPPTSEQPEVTESDAHDADGHAHADHFGTPPTFPPSTAAADAATSSTDPGGTSGNAAEPGTTTPAPSSPTTAPPATTATTVKSSTAPLVIPATFPYPGGLNQGEGFSFGLACIDTDTVTCDLNAKGKAFIGGFEYLGHGMPYLYSEAVEGNHDHAWWVDGDREGYRCAYGFLYDKHPNPFGMFPADRPAELIIRATIVRPLGQGYARVNDSHMSEAVRYFDGSLNNEPGNEISSEDCQASALDDFDYDGYEPQGPDAIRVGLFRGDGEVGDIRDFTKFAPQVPGHFEFISLKEGRVTLVFVLGASNKVSHVFYYDALNSGRIAVEVNGKLLQ
jgi:hypothetical protein